MLYIVYSAIYIYLFSFFKAYTIHVSRKERTPPPWVTACNTLKYVISCHIDMLDYKKKIFFILFDITVKMFIFTQVGKILIYLRIT